MFEVTVTTTISASHHLRGYNGKCENAHGHNYKVQATVRTDKIDNTGLALDFGVLRERLNQVAGKFDHTDLNQTEEFRELNPSSENLARVIYKQLKASIKEIHVTLVSTRVCETEGSCVVYYE